MLNLRRCVVGVVAVLLVGAAGCSSPPQNVSPTPDASGGRTDDVLAGQTLFPWVNSLRGLKGIRIDADAGENARRNFLLQEGIQADAERLLRELDVPVLEGDAAYTDSPDGGTLLPRGEARLSIYVNSHSRNSDGGFLYHVSISLNQNIITEAGGARTRDDTWHGRDTYSPIEASRLRDHIHADLSRFAEGWHAAHPREP